MFEFLRRKQVAKSEQAQQDDAIGEALGTMSDMGKVVAAGAILGAGTAAVAFETHPGQAKDLMETIHATLPGQYEQLTQDQMKTMQPAGPGGIQVTVDHEKSQATVHVPETPQTPINPQ